MDRYKEVIAMHTANNQAMSGVELIGIMELDELIELTINALANAELDDEEQEGLLPAKTVKLSVQDILMAITTPDTDKPLFHMISGASGGSHEGFYPESKDREDSSPESWNWTNEWNSPSMHSPARNQTIKNRKVYSLIKQ